MLGFGGKTRSASNPIGVAVSAQDVCLAQWVGGSYVLEREPFAQGVEVTGPDFHTETQRAMAAALRRGKFAGKQAISALPAELLRYKTLRLPPMPAEDMAQAVAWEAAERFQLTDNQSLQFYCAGQVNQGSEKREEVILLAAEKNAVYDHAMAVKRAGMQPVAIDATAAALARLLGKPNQSTLTISLGAGIAEIVGHRGDKVIFDKPIELTRKQGEIDAVALASEVALCLRYLSVTFAVHKPDAAWVTGIDATAALAQQLSDGLHVTVQTADLSPEMDSAHLPGPNLTQWCIAIGLSARSRQGSAQRGAA